MKRTLVMATLVLVTAGIVGSGFAGASGGPVVEERGFLCGVFDADDVLRFTTDSYFAEYANGKLYLRCVADGTNSSGVIHTTNFAKTGHTCFLGGVETTTWHTRHSRSGTAQLECFSHVNERQDIAAAAAGSAGQ